MPAYDCGARDCEECQRAFGSFGSDRSAAIASYERREKHFSLIEAARKNHSAPPCRVCLSTEKVAVYDDQNPFLTICPECCGAGAQHSDGETGHCFEYDRHERMGVCTKCCQPEHGDTGYISDRERI